MKAARYPFKHHLLKGVVIAFQLWGTGCENSNDGNIKSLILKNKEVPFIDQSLIDKEPLGQLINIGNYCDTATCFTLSTSSKVKVYAVGELVYQLSDVNPAYYFKSDDIELFFKSPGFKQDSVMKLSFSWLDGKSIHGNIFTEKFGATFSGALKIDSITSKYLVNISIPWDVLKIKPHAGLALPFDIAIGDNDDDYKQKAKLALYAKSDPMIQGNPRLGTLVLADSHKSPLCSSNLMKVQHYTLTQDTDITAPWKKIKARAITQIVMGKIKDKYDLSAKIKACWDIQALNFYVEIQDLNRKKIDPKKIKNLQTFLDYAWIADERGKMIWEMHDVGSPAGGAIKNRKIDTTITLKPGKYTLHYRSDESHSYNNWDDNPPNTPFYGVVVYQVK